MTESERSVDDRVVISSSIIHWHLKNQRQLLSIALQKPAKQNFQDEMIKFIASLLC